MVTGLWAELGLVGGVLASVTAAPGRRARSQLLSAPCALGLGAHSACTWLAVSVRTGMQPSPPAPQ